MKDAGPCMNDIGGSREGATSCVMDQRNEMLKNNYGFIESYAYSVSDRWYHAVQGVQRGAARRGGGS